MGAATSTARCPDHRHDAFADGPQRALAGGAAPGDPGRPPPSSSGLIFTHITRLICHAAKRLPRDLCVVGATNLVVDHHLDYNLLFMQFHRGDAEFAEILRVGDGGGEAKRRPRAHFRTGASPSTSDFGVGRAPPLTLCTPLQDERGGDVAHHHQHLQRVGAPRSPRLRGKISRRMLITYRIQCNVTWAEMSPLGEGGPTGRAWGPAVGQFS